jgi:lysozyme
MMRASDKLIAFLGSFERGPIGNRGMGGFAPRPYRCSAGKNTQGWGHVLLPGENFGVMTYAEAIALKQKDIAKFEKAVARLVKVPLQQHQFDALVALAFNIGEGALGTSTLLKKLNAGDYAGAAEQFLVWNKETSPTTGKKVASPGLTKRRGRESRMFATGIYENNE